MQIGHEEPPSVRGTKKKVAGATKVCTFEFKCMFVFQYICSDMYWWLFAPSKRGCLDLLNPLRRAEYFDKSYLLELLGSFTGCETAPKKSLYKLPASAKGMFTKWIVFINRKVLVWTWTSRMSLLHRWVHWLVSWITPLALPRLFSINSRY